MGNNQDTFFFFIHFKLLFMLTYTANGAVLLFNSLLINVQINPAPVWDKRQPMNEVIHSRMNCFDATWFHSKNHVIFHSFYCRPEEKCRVKK